MPAPRGVVALLGASLLAALSASAWCDPSSSSSLGVALSGAARFVKEGAEGADTPAVAAAALAAAPAALLGAPQPLKGYAGLQADLSALLAPEPVARPRAVLVAAVSGAAPAEVANALQQAGFEAARAAQVQGGAADAADALAALGDLPGLPQAHLDCAAACGAGSSNCTLRAVEGSPEATLQASLQRCRVALGGRAAEDAACAMSAAKALPALADKGQPALLWFSLSADVLPAQADEGEDAACGTPLVAEAVAAVAGAVAERYGGREHVAVLAVSLPRADGAHAAAHAAAKRRTLLEGPSPSGSAPTEADAIARFQFLAMRLFVVLLFIAAAITSACCICIGAEGKRDTLLFGSSSADKKTR